MFFLSEEILFEILFFISVFLSRKYYSNLQFPTERPGTVTGDRKLKEKPADTLKVYGYQKAAGKRRDAFKSLPWIQMNLRK